VFWWQKKTATKSRRHERTQKKNMNDNIKRESILAAANNLRWEVGENLHDALMRDRFMKMQQLLRAKL
jgi:hypothetical protein